MPKGIPKDPTKKRGFALMTKEEMARIASAGGKEAHRLGKAHRFTREEAKQAAAKSVAKRNAAKLDAPKTGS